jgi:hypothetical protein
MKKNVVFVLIATMIYTHTTLSTTSYIRFKRDEQGVERLELKAGLLSCGYLEIVPSIQIATTAWTEYKLTLIAQRRDSHGKLVQNLGEFTFDTGNNSVFKSRFYGGNTSPSMYTFYVRYQAYNIIPGKGRDAKPVEDRIVDAGSYLTIRKQSTGRLCLSLSKTSEKYHPQIKMDQ